MQALNYAKFLIFISLAVMLVNGMGIFNNTYIATDSSSYNDFSLESISNYTLPSQPSVIDYFMMAVTWAYQAFIMIINLILIPIKMLPWVMTGFGIPPMISVVLVVGISLSIIIGILQWISKQSTEAFE